MSNEAKVESRVREAVDAEIERIRFQWERQRRRVREWMLATLGNEAVADLELEPREGGWQFEFRGEKIVVNRIERWMSYEYAHLSRGRSLSEEPAVGVTTAAEFYKALNQLVPIR